MIKIKFSPILILLVAFFIVSCDPNIPQQEPSPPLLVTDNLEKLSLSDFPQLFTQGGEDRELPNITETVKSEKAFDLIARLSKLAEITQSPQLSNFSRIIKQKYMAKEISRRPLKSEIYFPVGLRELRTTLDQEMGQLIQEMSETKNILSRKFTSEIMVKKYFGGDTDISHFIPKFIFFLESVPKEFKHLGVNEKVIQAVKKELSSVYLPLLKELAPVFKKVSRSNSLKANLDSVTKGVVLSEDLFPDIAVQAQPDLKIAYDVEAMISDIDGSHDILRVIIKIWELMTPEQRLQIVKPESPTLYGYLNSLGKRGMKCLKATICNPLPPTPGVILALATKRFVMARILFFGIEKVRMSMDRGGSSYLVTTINSQITANLPNFIDLFRDKVTEEIDKKLLEIQQLKINEWSGLQTKLRSFLKSTVLKNSPGIYDMPPNHLNFSPYNGLSRLNQKNTSSDAGAVASMILALESQWQHKKSSRLNEEFFSLINWGLYFGGLAKSKNGSDLFQPYFNRPDPNYRIDTFFSNTNWVYGLPKSFSLPSSSKRTPSAVFQGYDQFLLLQSWSKMYHHFRDWEDSAYDKSLGKYTVHNFYPEVTGEPGKIKIFPKGQLSLLFLGLAGQVLENNFRTPGHIVLLNLDNEDVFLSNGNYDDVVMAYVRDLEGGKATETISSLATVQAILALEEFGKATKGIENTNLDFLKNTSGSGSIVSRVLEGQKDLPELQTALANFLIRYVLQENGEVCTTLNRNWDCLAVADGGTLPLRVYQAIITVYKRNPVNLYMWKVRNSLHTWLGKYQWKSFGFSHTKHQDPHPLEQIATAVELAHFLEYSDIFENQKLVETLQNKLLLWLKTPLSKK